MLIQKVYATTLTDKSTTIITNVGKLAEKVTKYINHNTCYELVCYNVFLTFLKRYHDSQFFLLTYFRLLFYFVKQLLLSFLQISLRAMSKHKNKLGTVDCVVLLVKEKKIK